MVSFTRCKLFRVVSLCVYKQHVLYVPFPLLEVKSQPLQKRRREKHVKTWPFLALATGEKRMGVLQGNMFSLHIIINKCGCVIHPKIPTKFWQELSVLKRKKLFPFFNSRIFPDQFPKEISGQSTIFFLFFIIQIHTSTFLCAWQAQIVVTCNSAFKVLTGL